MTTTLAQSLHPAPCRNGYAERERVRKDYDTFSEWSEKTPAHYSVCFGYLAVGERDLYDAFGQVLCAECITPRNPFADAVNRAFPIEFNVTADSPEMKLAQKFGAEHEKGYYAEEGYGWPVFGGSDACERCWNFLQEYAATKA